MVRARVALSLTLSCPGCALFGYDFAGVELAASAADAGDDDATRRDASAGACVPFTCAELGAQCGKALDGCGAVLDCGGCEAGVCGGGGKKRVGAVPRGL